MQEWWLFWQNNPQLGLWLIPILGLFVGSFINVIAYRLPIILFRHWRQEAEEYLQLLLPSNNATINLCWPRSHCPHCQKPLKLRHNIPFISYLWLRGKCYNCHHRIASRYFFTELLAALFSFSIVWHFGFGWAMLGGLCLVWGLLSLSIIDMEHQLLPDNLTLPLLWLGLCFNSANVYVSLHDALYGALLGYTSLWLFTKIFYWLTGKIGMGNGDFKLFALLGAWLGYQLLPLLLIIASSLGSLIGLSILLWQKRSRSTTLPFGPYLALAGWITLLWHAPILSWYGHFWQFN